MAARRILLLRAIVGGKVPIPVLIDSKLTYENLLDWVLSGAFPHPTANSAVGQTFTSLNQEGIRITEARFNLNKFATDSIWPTGILRARLYEITGTHGEDAVPTGDPLAESEDVIIEDLLTTYDWTTFPFIGNQRYVLSANKHYAIALIVASLAGGGGGGVHVCADYAGGHDGNMFQWYPPWQSWEHLDVWDLLFQIWGKG